MSWLGISRKLKMVVSILSVLWKLSVFVRYCNKDTNYVTAIYVAVLEWLLGRVSTVYVPLMCIVCLFKKWLRRIIFIFRATLRLTKCEILIQLANVIRDTQLKFEFARNWTCGLKLRSFLKKKITMQNFYKLNLNTGKVRCSKKCAKNINLDIGK